MKPPGRQRANARQLYDIDAYNDGVQRARAAYQHDHHCHCGAIVPPAHTTRQRTCDDCRREREAGRKRTR